MSPQDQETAIESLVSGYESGELGRRDLIKRLVGVAALPGFLVSMAGCSEGSDTESETESQEIGSRKLPSDAQRKILYERIVNQPVDFIKADGENPAKLKLGEPVPPSSDDPPPDDLPPRRAFESFAEHGAWLYGTAFIDPNTEEPVNIYEAAGLKQIEKPSNRHKAIRRDTRNSHKGTDPARFQRGEQLRKTMQYINESGNLGTAAPTNYLDFPQDIYGLMKAKLDWVAKHSVIHVLDFLEKRGGWPKEGDSNVNASVDSMNALLAKFLEDDGDDENTEPIAEFWEPLVEKLYHGVSLGDEKETIVRNMAIEYRKAIARDKVNDEDVEVAFSHTEY